MSINNRSTSDKLQWTNRAFQGLSGRTTLILLINVIREVVIKLRSRKIDFGLLKQSGAELSQDCLKIQYVELLTILI